MVPIAKQRMRARQMFVLDFRKSTGTKFGANMDMRSENWKAK